MTVVVQQATGRAPAADEVRTSLAATAVFAGFAESEILALVERHDDMRLIAYPSGADLVREGDPATALLVLRAGEASVLKRGDGDVEHAVNRLAAGDCIGELALIDPGPRSATVRALGPVEVLQIPIADMLDLAARRPGFAIGVLGIARLVAQRLRRSTDNAVQSLERALGEERTRSAMGKFTFMLIVTYSLYTWVLGTATQVKQALGRSELVTLPAVVITVAMLWWFKRSSGYPAAFFGLTRKQAGRHTLEALALTLPMMALTVLLKWWMVGHVASMLGAPLLQMFTPPAPGVTATPFNPWLTLAYLLFVPLQELIYRGGLQGSLEHFLTGARRHWAAIFGSNIIFSAAHLYISPGLSVSAFVAGLFWGWLYSHQRSLVGVSLSHAVLGFFAFEVVDLGVLQ